MYSQFPHKPIVSRENSWYKKLRDHSLYDVPVVMTYFLEPHVKITASVIIRDNYADETGEYIILANGTMMALKSVVDIFPHPAIKHEVQYHLDHSDTYSLFNAN